MTFGNQSQIYIGGAQTSRAQIKGEHYNLVTGCSGDSEFKEVLRRDRLLQGLLISSMTTACGQGIGTKASLKVEWNYGLRKTKSIFNGSGPYE